ncbi:MAG TPA: nucleoside deaminase [Prolixibacteraceae bacterium]|nr:nucleoside deaminase [Prolixibacteraceae bacterium]
MSENVFMSRAISLAKKNVLAGGGPFGAIIVKDGHIIAEGVNQVTLRNDPTAHAEVQAIREACRVLCTFDLSGCEIYTSCEPCPMCFSAIYWAHLKSVYYAADHSDAEKAGFADAHIYREIELDEEKRSIRFINIDHSHKLLPFECWTDNNDKTEY